MRNFMKRLSVGLVVLLIAGISTGCNQSKDKVVNKVNNTDIYQQKQLKQETITLYLPGDEPQGVRKVLSEIEKQTKSTLNVKLNFKWFSKESYLQQVKSQLDSSSAPDAFILSRSDAKDEIAELTKEDKVMDLTALFPQTAPKLNDRITEEEKQNVTYDGKLVAVPSLLPLTKRACVVVNEEIAKKYNISEIKNINELEYLMQTLKGKESSIAPVAVKSSTIDLFADMYGYIQIGDYLVYKKDDQQMKVMTWEQTPEFGQIVKKLIQWRTSNLDMGNAAPDTNEIAMIQQGLAASAFTDLDGAYQYLHYLAGSGLKVRIFPLYPEQESQRTTDTAAIAINKNSKHAERVLKFLDWIQSSQENYDLFMYGIKDENYALSGDKIDFPADKVKYFGWGGYNTFVNLDFTRTYVWDPENFKEEYKKISETNAKFPSTLGFNFENTTVQDVSSKRREAYDNVELQHGGFVNSQDVDTFLKQQGELGVEKLVNEMQRQLDKWKVDNKK